MYTNVKPFLLATIVFLYHFLLFHSHFPVMKIIRYLKLSVQYHHEHCYNIQIFKDEENKKGYQDRKDHKFSPYRLAPCKHVEHGIKWISQHGQCRQLGLLKIYASDSGFSIHILINGMGLLMNYMATRGQLGLELAQQRYYIYFIRLI